MDEALAYIPTMPVPGEASEPDTERERELRALLRSGRFLLSFDGTGRMQLVEVEPNAMVVQSGHLAHVIGDPMSGAVRRADLPKIIEAAVKRLA